MFGVVPRVLWEKKAQPDELNRITLNVNSLFVDSCGARILVEAGMGSKYDERRRSLYALREGDVVSGLAGIGVSPEEIDIVVLTHLHLDHAGGSTCQADPEAGEAEPRPAFPRARYVIQRSELDMAKNPHPLARGSYASGDFMPLEREGRLEVVEGDAEIAPGLGVELTGGHTPGHQAVRLVSRGEEGLFTGDLVPTLAHLRLHWLMSWDLEPAVVYAEKKRLLSEAAERGTMLFISHDPRYAACRIEGGPDTSYTPVDGTLLEAAGTVASAPSEKGD